MWFPVVPRLITVFVDDVLIEGCAGRRAGRAGKAQLRLRPGKEAGRASGEGTQARRSPGHLPAECFDSRTVWGATTLCLFLFVDGSEEY